MDEMHHARWLPTQVVMVRMGGWHPVYSKAAEYMLVLWEAFRYSSVYCLLSIP